MVGERKELGLARKHWGLKAKTNFSNSWKNDTFQQWNGEGRGGGGRKANSDACAANKVSAGCNRAGSNGGRAFMHGCRRLHPRGLTDLGARGRRTAAGCEEHRLAPPPGPQPHPGEPSHAPPSRPFSAAPRASVRPKSGGPLGGSPHSP